MNINLITIFWKGVSRKQILYGINALSNLLWRLKKQRF